MTQTTVQNFSTSPLVSWWKCPTKCPTGPSISTCLKPNLFISPSVKVLSEFSYFSLQSGHSLSYSGLDLHHALAMFSLFSHVLCPTNYSELVVLFPLPVLPSAPCWDYTVVTRPVFLILSLLLLPNFLTTPALISLNQHCIYPSHPQNCACCAKLNLDGPPCKRSYSSQLSLQHLHCSSTWWELNQNSLPTCYFHFHSDSLLVTCTLTAPNFLSLVMNNDRSIL